jgi:hypothetical protein
MAERLEQVDLAHRSMAVEEVVVEEVTEDLIVEKS